MFNYKKSNVFKFDESLFKNTLIPTYPDTDIERVDNAFVIQIDVPGYDKNNINISYENDVLSVSGIVNEITAKCENGVLTIKVPLRESEDKTENKIKIN